MVIIPCVQEKLRRFAHGPDKQQNSNQIGRIPFGPQEMQLRFGKLRGRCRGAINGAHGLSGDAEGNLYLSELPPQEITKLERLN